MVDFRSMPPVDPKRRKLKAQAVTNLMNGAAFKFLSFTEGGFIRGKYLDYAGEWCHAVWYDTGRPAQSDAPEDLCFDWSTAR
jgi:hypothetical protein